MPLAVSFPHGRISAHLTYSNSSQVAFLTSPEGRKDREIIVIQDSRTGNLMTNLPKSAQYHAMLQNLFTYSFFVHTDDGT